MSTAELESALKSGALSRAYLLCGEESYLRRNYKARFFSLFAGDSMNVTLLREEAANEDNIIAAADTLPFFAEHRLVFVEESGLFQKSADKLADYLPALPESTLLVFSEESVDKRTRLYKAVAKLGGIVECAHPAERDLKLWAARYLLRSGKKIQERVLEQLLAAVGGDMEMLGGELEKLIAYLGARDVVTREDLAAIISVSVENRIFDMIAASCERKTDRALSLYGDLLALKEKPGRILAMLSRQYRQLRLVKAFAAEGKREKEIAELAGQPQWLVRKLLQMGRQLSLSGLAAAERRAAVLETAYKSGRMGEQLAVELLLCDSDLTEYSL